MGAMLKAAEEFAEEDRMMREKVEAKNGLESFAFGLKSQLEDEEKLAGKLSEEDKDTVEEAVNMFLTGFNPTMTQRRKTSTRRSPNWKRLSTQSFRNTTNNTV